ncbi:MAG TPA: serpin family protein, partial [Clostridia bacterium]|nr:serpin family protein [Clostridia bacterium]
MNMKKGMALAMGLLILLTTVLACGPANPVDSGKKTKPEKTEGERAQAQALALILPGALPLDLPNNMDVSDAMRRALWTFAGKTAGPALAGQGQENSLYSPVSLYYALAILEAGAAGETKAGLKSFLESEGLDLGEELQTLYALMTRERDGSVEDLANGIWIKEDLLEGQERPVKQDWLDYLSRHLYASAFAVDFSNPATAEQMSAWVAEASHGKIKPDIQLDDPLLYMVLMNTLYFQAEWSAPFDPTPLKEAFYPEQGAPVEASYLTKIFQQYPAQKTDQYTALAVALKNGSISFVLPAPGISPQSLLEDPDLLVKLWEREGESLYDV